jgi:hypothetical protein
MSDHVESATSGDFDLIKTRTAIHEAETQLAYLKLRLRTGELLDRKKVEAAMASVGRRHRDLLQALPVRHAHELAAECGVSGRAMLAALEDIVHDALCEIAAAARGRKT